MSATANGVDPALVTRIVDRVKSQGIFDQFRRECLADVDTKPAYQNLGARVEGYVSTFLSKFVWTADMNKNHLRNSLRREINESEMLASGVERVIEQIVDAQIQHIFLPRIETVVKDYLHSDNAPSTSNDAKSLDPSKQGLETGNSGTIPSPAFTGLAAGIKGSPADSPRAGRSTSSPALQSASPALPTPPPLPGENIDQPKPPPLPDASTAQEKPQPPPLPRSREASPPPLPPSALPERKRTESVSSTPSLDSVSSDPLSISSDDEKPTLTPEKTTPAKLPAAMPSKSAKATPGKVPPGKKRIILKKVVVRKADGTKVVRVVRMDPTKATAKKLLMRAAARQAGDQSTSPKGKASPIAIRQKSGAAAEGKGNTSGGDQNLAKDIKPDIKPKVNIEPGVLSKDKDTPTEVDTTVVLTHPKVIKSEPASSGDEWQSSKAQHLPSSRIAKKLEPTVGLTSSDSSPPVVKTEALPKDLEDISSSSESDVNFEDTACSTKDTAAVKKEEEEEATGYFPDDASDLESHASDVTVSSVHTSDLSSFDEKISSSSSSSSSSDEESAEEDTDEYGTKTSDKAEEASPNSKAAALLLAKGGAAASRERSTSPASSAGKSSPRSSEARWKRQHMVDAEDEETRNERRRKAAEAKEERAKRRQQLKEEREKERRSSPMRLETRRGKRGREDSDMDRKLTKQQLKEQKLQEKQREAKRQRTLLSQSDDSVTVAMDPAPSCRRDHQWTPPPIYQQELYRRERRKAIFPFHYLLTYDLVYKQLVKKSQQRAKYRATKLKEEGRGKRSICRFGFSVSSKTRTSSTWQEEAAKRRLQALEKRGQEIAAGTEKDLTGEGVSESKEAVECDVEEEKMDLSLEPLPTVPANEPESGAIAPAIVADESKLSTDELIPSVCEPELTSAEHEESDGELVKAIGTSESSAAEINNDLVTSVEKKDEPANHENEDIAFSEKAERMCTKESVSEQDISREVSEAKIELPVEDMEMDRTDTGTSVPSDSESSTARESGQEVSAKLNQDNERDAKVEAGEVSSVTEKILQEENEPELTEPEAEIRDEKTEEGKLDKEEILSSDDDGNDVKGGKEKSDSNAEEEVPTFVVLEREEISSGEEEFEDFSKDQAPKIPSIFQQTEAISSDEELEEIAPSPLPKKIAEQKSVNQDEEKSEGEVDEEGHPVKERGSIVKLTEDISGDELSETHSIENPPTPTLDEPAEFEGMQDDAKDGQPAIPIVLVHSPKGGLKARMAEGPSKDCSSASSSDAEVAKGRAGTPQVEERKEEGAKKEEIEEGELEGDIEEGEVREEKEPRTSRGTRSRVPSGTDNAQGELPGYGKRTRRRTHSPHPGKEEEYLYFGLPKRSRRHSPPPTAEAAQSASPQVGSKKPVMREQSQSGGAMAKDSPAPGGKEQMDQAPLVVAERRSSRSSRKVSPPRRYSPSEQRTAAKTKGPGVSVPPASSTTSPVPMAHEDATPTSPPPQSQQPQQHRHFTRRMSGRDEERRPHRYEDMYYYDNKRSKANASPGAATSKAARGTSAEERKRKR